MRAPLDVEASALAAAHRRLEGFERLAAMSDGAIRGRYAALAERAVALAGRVRAVQQARAARRAAAAEVAR